MHDGSCILHAEVSSKASPIHKQLGLLIKHIPVPLRLQVSLLIRFVVIQPIVADYGLIGCSLSLQGQLKDYIELNRPQCLLRPIQMDSSLFII